MIQPVFFSPVTDGPSFRVPPSDQYAEVGENVTLSCQVDSMPDPTIVWINQQTQTVAGTGSELRVSVSKNTVGVYQCIAKVEGFPEISDTVGVFLKVNIHPFSNSLFIIHSFSICKLKYEAISALE